jgi:hypothetical protein
MSAVACDRSFGCTAAAFDCNREVGEVQMGVEDAG